MFFFLVKCEICYFVDYNTFILGGKGEKYSIFTEKGYFPLNSKRKHSEIWNEFIKFQGSVLSNSLPIKFLKCKFLQELCFNKLLLKKVKTYRALAQRVKHKEFWLPVVLFLDFNI